MNRVSSCKLCLTQFISFLFSFLPKIKKFLLSSKNGMLSTNNYDHPHCSEEFNKFMLFIELRFVPEEWLLRHWKKEKRFFRLNQTNSFFYCSKHIVKKSIHFQMKNAHVDDVQDKSKQWIPKSYQKNVEYRWWLSVIVDLDHLSMIRLMQNERIFERIDKFQNNSKCQSIQT